MAPRGKRKTQIENTLLTALRFVASAQKSIGSPEQTHCRIGSGWAMASNSILSAAHSIIEDINCCPHTFTFVDALEQAKGPITLTVLDALRLQVRSGDFQAIIPCIEPSALPSVFPDTPIAICDNRLKDALTIVGTLAVDGAQKVVNASVQLRNGTVIGSDGNLILEAFHGIGMPNMLVPKTFITALQKNTKAISRMGFCEHSFTIWYEDGNWLKTQLYPHTTELPDLYKFLNVETLPSALPKNLFEVARHLQPFSDNGQIYFTEDGARVISGLTNATEAIKGVPPGICFSMKSILAIEKLAKTIHFNATPGASIFFGDNIRGAISTKVGG
jgi:hypothetical protein